MNFSKDKHTRIVLLFDVKNSNPNGDPDNGGAPRVLSDIGIITNQSTSNKIRLLLEQEEYNLYIKKNAILEQKIKNANKEIEEVNKKIKKNNKDLLEHLCNTFIDIRYFGGTFATINESLKAPFKFNNGASLHPIKIKPLPGSSKCSLKAKTTVNQMLYEEYVVEYGLYKQEIIYNPHDANKTFLTQKDFELFFLLLPNLFNHTGSTTRNVELKNVIILQEERKYISLDSAMNKIKISLKPDIEYPSKYDDYDINTSELINTDKYSVYNGLDEQFIDTLYNNLNKVAQIA